MTPPRAGLLAIALMMGCTKAEPPPARASAKASPPHVVAAEPPSKAPQPEPQAEPQPEDDAPEKPVPPAGDPRFRCAADGDCTQTCALGAVNAAWLRAHTDADTCDDGCYWKSDSVACKDGSCATLTDDGEVDPGCTHVTAPRW